MNLSIWRVYAFNKYLLSNYYIPRTILDVMREIKGKERERGRKAWRKMQLLCRPRSQSIRGHSCYSTGTYKLQREYKERPILVCILCWAIRSARAGPFLLYPLVSTAQHNAWHIAVTKEMTALWLGEPRKTWVEASLLVETQWFRNGQVFPNRQFLGLWTRRSENPWNAQGRRKPISPGESSSVSFSKASSLPWLGSGWT